MKSRLQGFLNPITLVALFTRAWIEICYGMCVSRLNLVALFTRAWIEISAMEIAERFKRGRPFHEGVD